MSRFSAFSMNVNTIDLKLFPTMVEYTSLRENSSSILERDEVLRSL